MQWTETSGSRSCRFRPRLARLGPAGALLVLLLVPAACRRDRPGDLRVGLSSGLSSLDPHLSNTVADIELLGNVYEPLVSLDAEMRAVPALAASWSNPDPVTWVFRLRPSATFHDGTPLTPRDVVFSLTRPRHDARLQIAEYLATVDTVSARGKETVVVTTRWPNALLLGSLSFVPIVPGGSTTESLAARPAGTGPWKVVSWSTGRLHLARFGGYWGPRPPFDRAIVDLGISEKDALAGLGSGRWDVVRYSSHDVEAFARQREGWTLVPYPNVFLRHLAFDVSRAETPYCPGIPNPFRSRAVRRAISLALDRTALARRVDPDAIAALQLVPPSIFGFDPTAPPLAHDADEARRLLAAAGYPGGFDVVLHRSGYGAAAEEVRAQLAEVGIRVQVRQLPSAAFFEALDRRALSFWIVADGCMTGDALEILLASFSSPDSTLGAGVDNYGGYRSAEVDRAVDEALRQMDPANRLPTLQRGLKAALDDVAWVPLYFSRDTLAVRRPLTYRPRADGLLRLSNVGPGD